MPETPPSWKQTLIAGREDSTSSTLPRCWKCMYSSAITRGYRWKLFVALLAASALNALSVPFSMGLQKIGEGGAAPLLIFGAVPLLACMFVVTPWIGPSFASAYESLCTAKEEVGHTSDTTGKDS